MKFLSVIFILVVCVVYASSRHYSHDHNGRPLCVTDEDMERPLRNNYDPTKYWYCLERYQPAMSMTCPPNTGFINNGKFFGCMTWDHGWEWVFPVDPEHKAPHE